MFSYQNKEKSLDEDVRYINRDDLELCLRESTVTKYTLRDKLMDLHGRPEPEPPWISTSILRGVGKTSIDCLRPNIIIHRGSMDENGNHEACVSNQQHLRKM